MQQFSVRIGQRLLEWNRPIVMGIVNVTPDSFSVHCSSCTEAAVLASVTMAVQQGASILDIGGYSTRPGAVEVSEDEEYDRLEVALRTIRNHYPDMPLSVDTFRSRVAERVMHRFGDIIINDVSGGEWDSEMFAFVSRSRVPYILTHTGWQDIHQSLRPRRYEDILSEVLDFFQTRIDCLSRMGVTDIILDPGFGLGKTVEESYCLLRHLDLFQTFRLPVLAGLSRKSMFFKPLGITPMQALNATTAGNMLALERGASILRVHDVCEAQQAVQIYCLTHQND